MATERWLYRYLSTNIAPKILNEDHSVAKRPSQPRLKMREKNHPGQESATLDDVEGFATALAKQSHTTSEGLLRIRSIDGVKYRLARPVSHHHGYLTEAFRTDWGFSDFPIVQVNLTTTFPGKIRAWGIHKHTTDHLFAATGSLCIVCYDGRRGSPSFGRVNEFMLGERNQGLVVIPPGVFHGWKNVGDTEATIVSMPSQLYDHDGPDRWELLWNSDTAKKIIPYEWP
jgi:dTDP-4-dehydrorhamnose 3,5-epimerase